MFEYYDGNLNFNYIERKRINKKKIGLIKSEIEIDNFINTYGI